MQTHQFYAVLPEAAAPDHLPVGDSLEDWEETSSSLPAQNCEQVQRSKVRRHSWPDPEGQELPRGWGEQGLLAGPLSGHSAKVQG